MQDTREYFHHEMRHKRRMMLMERIVLWLLYLVAFVMWGFFLYAYVQD